MRSLGQLQVSLKRVENHLMVARLCQAINQARTKCMQESILYNLAFLVLKPEAAVSDLWAAELTAPTGHTGLHPQLQAPGAERVGRPHGGSAAPGCSCVPSSRLAPTCVSPEEPKGPQLRNAVSRPSLKFAKLSLWSFSLCPNLKQAPLVPGYPSHTTFLF